jgi:hypothetical protein
VTGEITRRHALGICTAVGTLYGVSAVLLTYPMASRLADHLFGGGDSFFLPWVLARVFHSLARAPSKLFDANIFYPAPDSLAFSEHHLSAQLLYAPLYALSGNPVLSYNLVLLLSFVCSGLAMFALVRHITGDSVAAAIAGFAFAFSPPRFAHYPHLQFLLIWWSPLALLFLERHLLRRSWRDFALFCATFWLQWLASTYLGLFLATMVVVRLGCAARSEPGVIRSLRALGEWAAFAAGSVVVLTPFMLPYLRVSRQWGFTRSLMDNISGSAEPSSYLTVFPGNYLYGDLLSNFSYLVWPKPLFPGFLPIALALLGGWVALRRDVQPSLARAGASRAYLVVGAAAFVLSLGPFLIWRGHVTSVPLPYLAFYHLVPGYQAIRVPARLGLWVGLVTSILAGVGYHWLRETIGKRWAGWRALPLLHGMLGAFVVGGFALEAYSPVRPLPVPVNERVPAVYRFLAAKGTSPLIELPMPKTVGRDVVHSQEMKRTYFSIYHRRPMVNGYSGFTPPSFDEIATFVNTGPRPEVVDALAALGVRTVVLHLDEMSGAERRAWEGADLGGLGLREVAGFGGDRVLDIVSEPGPRPGLTAGLDLPETVPPGGAVRAGLRLSSASRQPWVDRPLERWVDVEVRWKSADGCDAAVAVATMAMPLVLFHENPAPLSLTIPTPGREGAYRVTVSSPLFSGSRDVRIREVFPGGAADGPSMAPWRRP